MSKIIDHSPIQDYYSLSVTGAPPIFIIEYADGLRVTGSRYIANIFLADGRVGSVVLAEGKEEVKPLPSGTNLPIVRHDYSLMNPGNFKGRAIRSIINPESIKLIALIEDHGLGSLLTPNKPLGSDQLIQLAFASDAKAQEWGYNNEMPVNVTRQRACS